MVTKVEAYNSDEKSWIPVGLLPPGQRGSMSQNLPDGGREIYVFECSLDDTHTTLSKGPFGVDIEVGRYRVLDTLEGMEVVQELRIGDPAYVLSIKTDKSEKIQMVRFSHV